jgi:tetratricopeptide (TPR) repeat protein
MKTVTIKNLVYVIQQAKENKQPRPVFFLGAGVSKSGGIPLAPEIAKDILKNYSTTPSIEKLKEDEETYSKLMDCLQPYERDNLLKDYIKKAKINVAHIYLAQLLKYDFIDYILTVNFDNLMLKALALFNEFPPIYDMAILKELTTTIFKEKSVVFLHGQHHGPWLLNTNEEMGKVEETVPRVFENIKNRPWIFIGYSGNDPIFGHIQNLGRFDHGFYWITHNKDEPSKQVTEFLEKKNTNTSVIKGYDADSFMLKLNSELGLEEPKIVDKPFTSLNEMLGNIVDVDDDKFKAVKERLEIAKKNINEAIKLFENDAIKAVATEDLERLKETSKINSLKKEIIKLAIEENYPKDSIEKITQKAKQLDNNEIDNLLADLYYNWGNILGDLAKTKEEVEAEKMYQQALEKFQKAGEIKPDHEVYSNWGNILDNLAKIKEGAEAEKMYQQTFEKYRKASEIKPNRYDDYNKWGIYLSNLAKTKKGAEAEKMYQQAFEKFQKAIEIKPDKYNAYYNWGAYLGDLATTKEGAEAERLYQQTFEKYQKAG